MNRLCFLVSAFALATWAAAGPIVFVDTEGFEDRGGWVIDQQFMDEMGSSFLLAHGWGTPVADASTTLTFPEPGEYRVWVRTRDWVGPWKRPGTPDAKRAAGSPGVFRVLIDGDPLPVTFGEKGAGWHWQDGGTITIRGNTAKVALHDLTGFDGRCDAICFAKDQSYTPPNDTGALAALRRKALGQPDTPTAAGTFDLVVVGGGTAGTCAAITAGRLGLKVAFIQDRPVLGGNNSSEVRVWLSGTVKNRLYAGVGTVLAELEQKKRAHYGPGNTAEIYEDAKKEALVRAEDTIALYLGHRGNAVEMKNGRIHAVVAQNIVTNERLRFVGRLFADCTGDGAIGALAGADFDMTRKGHMGRCNLWNVKDTGKPVSFPRCPWALDLSEKPFPGRHGKGGITKLGGWYWESGFDHDPILEREYIRDWNLRAAFGAWDCIKNVDKTYPNHTFNWIAYVSGPRESRRLLGDVVLNKEHLAGKKVFEDGCVVTGWKMDLHLPDPRYEKGFEGDAFISRAHFTSYPMPFHIPYRCFYSRNIPNLFMAGRDVSVTHDALGTVRVMRTGGMMGEAVGMAAAICMNHDTDPRGVYEKHWSAMQELMKVGAGKPVPLPTPTLIKPPDWLKGAGPSLAKDATITVSGSLDTARYPVKHLQDGKVSYTDNHLRWVSDKSLPIRADLTWDEPKTLTAVRIVSGYWQGGATIAPISDFNIQYKTDGKFVDVPEGKVMGNSKVDWSMRLPGITTDALRLEITKTHSDQARIWEIEAY